MLTDLNVGYPKLKEQEPVLSTETPVLFARDLIDRSKANRHGFVAHIKYLLEESNNKALTYLLDEEITYQFGKERDFYYTWSGIYWILANKLRIDSGLPPITVNSDTLIEIWQEEEEVVNNLGENLNEYRGYGGKYLKELIFISCKDESLSDDMGVFWREFATISDTKEISPRPVLAFIRAIDRASSPPEVLT
jgi:hypothetical protein